MIIELDENIHIKEWRKFLELNNHRIYHTPEFKKFMKKSLGLKTVYLAYAETKNQDIITIKTLLPISFVKSVLFGKRIISIGMNEYGGFAGDKDHIDHILAHLADRYKNLFDYIELRQGIESFDQDLDKRFPNYKLKRFELHLSSPEKSWQSIQKEKRKAIRKSKKKLITRELSESDISDMYKLYLHNMRRFGTPPYPKSFFTSFFRYRLGKCFGAFDSSKLVAFLLGYTYRDRIHVIISNAYPEYLKFRCNDAVHWAFIEWGCNHDFKIFDFGIVRPDSGQFEYKKKWGAVLKDLNRHIIFLKKNALSDPDPDDPRFKTFIRIYRKLPIILTRIIGKLIRSSLGI